MILNIKAHYETQILGIWDLGDYLYILGDYLYIDSNTIHPPPDMVVFPTFPRPRHYISASGLPPPALGLPSALIPLILTDNPEP
jgi:hypothetical protein